MHAISVFTGALSCQQTLHLQKLFYSELPVHVFLRGQRAVNSHFKTGQLLQPQEQPKQKLSTSQSFPVCRGQSAQGSVAVALIISVL